MKKKLVSPKPPIVPADNPWPQTTRLGQFLVPIDFSEASINALRHAQHLAVSERVGLILVNVIEEPLSFRTVDSVGQRRERKNERLAQLESLARREVGSAITLKAVVCDGSPAEEIARVAASDHCDMIIVGRHDHRGLGRWFRGHTATQLVRRAHCPVMVLGRDGPHKSPRPNS